MSKVVKRMVMDELLHRIGDVREMLVVDTSKLDAITANHVRIEWQKLNISALTVKNALAKRALGEIGIDSLDEVLQGPSTLVWGGEDIVALSKEIAKWAKNLGDLQIKGGSAEGQGLDAGDVDALSKSPGRLELIGQIASATLSGGSNIAGALLAAGGTIAGQIESMSEGSAESE